MSKFKELKAIIAAINKHPLAGRHPLRASVNFIWWQMYCLSSAKEKRVKFTNRTFLVAKKGMVGATGNIYSGLHEFADMGFLLHFLRKSDLFYDVGANIGSYTILASGHIGARTIAFEPILSTFNALKKNIDINKVGTLVNSFNVGVGSKEDKLYFTVAHDTINHVVLGDVDLTTDEVVEVKVVTIDNIVLENGVPILIKIDVEGFESEVLKGMLETILIKNLKAIIIESNGSGGRYGYDETIIHAQLREAGFSPYEYQPFLRKLVPLKGHSSLNTLYLRDIEFIENRISSAEKISIFSESF